MSKKILSLCLIVFITFSVFGNEIVEFDKEHTERYACAFSSLLAQMNALPVTSFNYGENVDKQCRLILKNSWSITNYEQLISQIDDLLAHGHNGTFLFLAGLIEKNENLKPIEIIAKECLTGSEGTRLFYVYSIKDKLGPLAISAWDKARCINLLRWSISAGYITEEEALQRAAPIVESLINEYATWDDFFAHYIAGRQFYGATDNSSSRLAVDAVKYCKQVHNKIDFENLPLQGTASFTGLLNYDDTSLLYEISSEAKRWYELQELFDKFSEKNISKTTNKLAEIKKKQPEYADIPFVEYFDSMLLSNQKKGADIWRCSFIYDKLKKQLENIPSDRTLYKWINMDFARIHLILDRPEKALDCIALLPDETAKSGYFQMLKGVSYLYLIGTSPDFEVNANYESNAYEALSSAESQEYPLSDSTLQWMREYERKRDSN